MRLHDPECPLTYLDSSEITIPEILESWSDTDFSDDRSLFTYRVIRRRQLDGKDPTELISFDISGNNLESIDVSEFKNLQVLNISSNRLSSNSFLSSGVSKLMHLANLNLNHNRLDSFGEFLKTLDKLTHLEILKCVENPCFDTELKKMKKKGKSTKEEKVRLLFGSLKRSARLDFKLTSIDGIKYGLEQRYEAMIDCDRGEEVSNARLANYFKEEGIKGTEDKLNLSNKDLITLLLWD